MISLIVHYIIIILLSQSFYNNLHDKQDFDLNVFSPVGLDISWYCKDDWDRDPIQNSEMDIHFKDSLNNKNHMRLFFYNYLLFLS